MEKHMLLKMIREAVQEAIPDIVQELKNALQDRPGEIKGLPETTKRSAVAPTMHKVKDPEPEQDDDISLDDIESFDDYVAKLRRLPAIRRQPKARGFAFEIEGADVHGRSYIRDLSEARNAFSKGKPLMEMSDTERQLIGGTKGKYVYLGNMARQVDFRKMIEAGGNAIASISGVLDNLPFTGTLHPEIIKDVLSRLCDIKYVGLAVSTRLITMKRPDVCLPITSTNKKKAQRFLGDVEIRSIDDYMTLLDKVWSRSWYQSPSKRPSAQTFWPYRAALLDAFLYDP
jgi:hypothetical protein